MMESRSSGVGTKLPLSLDRKGKVLVEFRKKSGGLVGCFMRESKSVGSLGGLGI